jgi:hypothetical protein
MATSNPGRPSLLVNAQPAILLGLRRGITLEDSARAGGVSYRTLRTWVLRGEAERERLSEDGATPLKEEAAYLAFLEQYEEAQAQGQMVLADIVRQAADGGATVRETRTTELVIKGQVVEARKTTVERESGADWRAAAFMLERRFGWGRQDRQELFSIDLEDLSDDELQRIANGEDPLAVVATRKAAAPGSGALEVEEGAES